MSMGTSECFHLFNYKHSLILLILVLNPREKMAYFKSQWSADLQDDVVKCVEDVVGSVSYRYGY